MAYQDFNPFGVQSVRLSFLCKKCQAPVISHDLHVPPPDYSAELGRDSHIENDDTVYCDSCDYQYEVRVASGYTGGYIEINDLDDDIEVNIDVENEPPEDYDEERLSAILANTNAYNTFNEEVAHLNLLNDLTIEDPSADNALRRHLHIGAITCLETYLSDTFVNLVLSDDDRLATFIKTYKELSKKKFTLADIFEYTSVHKLVVDEAKEALLEIVYHNLPKVSALYRQVLEIEFPKFGDIQKLVLVRHDLVHRNGKTNDGSEIAVDRQSVADMIDQIQFFVYTIDKQVKRLEWDGFPEF